MVARASVRAATKRSIAGTAVSYRAYGLTACGLQAAMGYRRRGPELGGCPSSAPSPRPQALGPSRSLERHAEHQLRQAHEARLRADLAEGRAAHAWCSGRATFTVLVRFSTSRRMRAAGAAREPDVLVGHEVPVVAVRRADVARSCGARCPARRSPGCAKAAEFSQMPMPHSCPSRSRSRRAERCARSGCRRSRRRPRSRCSGSGCA